MSGQIQHEEVSASVLPSDLPDRIVSDIGQFSVGLFGVRETNTSQPQRFCGSGTLVVAAGTHFVLTAAHVWEALKSRDRIGITLRDSYAVIIEKEGMSDVTPGREKPGGVEWGPDLSLLRLPAEHIGSISAVKTFYNLSKKRHRTFGLNEIEMWLLLGAPREYASFPVDQQTLTAHASLQMTGFFLKQVKARHRKNDFDYVDMEVSVPSHNVPSTFGGMSGGGLWHLFVSPTGQYDRTYRLEGVIFYESPDVDGRCFVRSHGRKSIGLLVRQVEERSA